MKRYWYFSHCIGEYRNELDVGAVHYLIYVSMD